MNARTITDAAQRCLASFDAIDLASAAGVPGCPSNEDGRSRYHIWASNLGSFHPGTDRRSADHRLREAPEVVERIVELLDELTEINSDILEIVSGDRTNRQMSESDDVSESSDELSELSLSVGDVITSLFKVSMLVKKATARDRYAKAASAKEHAFLADFDIRHVADKYPKLRTRPWLLERLGKAITQRRQFLRYCRNHKHRIAHVATPDTLVNGRLPRSARIDGNLDVPTHTANAASTTNTPLTRPTLTPTTATTLYADRIAQEDLQDLDRDDAASQATSVAYSQIDPDDSGTLHVPQLEDVSHGIQPFECTFCFGIVQAKRQHSWRKHVLSDLRAYVCLSTDCDAGLFEDKLAWQAHDTECHQRQWSCTQCRIGPFASATSLQGHLHSTHEIGRLPEDVVAKMVSSSSHSVSEVAPDCPFCDFEDDIRKDGMTRGQDLSPGTQIVVPLADYHRHLAFHQEQLALFAIPPAIERSLEWESNDGRSKVDPHENVQSMTIWQKNLDEIHIEDSPGDVQVATTDTRDEPIFSAPGLDDTVSPTQSEDSGVPQDLSIGDTSMYVPAEEQFPRILPGDIVYIPQETNKQLSYKKGIYLGRSKDNKHTARDWNTRSDVEVSLTTLVRKTDCTTEEKEEAALLRAHQTPGTGDAHPRYYLKKHLLSVEACYTLLSEALQLAHGTREITGYDESLIKPIFSDFAQRFSGRSLENGVKLEDIVRMFYAIATSEQSKDATTSDAMWKAHVERSAALLTDVLIEVVEGQYDVNTAVVAQLRAEQAQMVGRANEAVKLASGSYFRQSFTDRQTTYDDAEGNQLEIDSVTFKSLKLRVHDVATGQEQLLGFGDDDIKRTFQAFSQFLDASPLAGTSLVEEIVRDFRRCALFELNMDETLSRTQRNTMVRRQEALLLSLLISVDAQVQLELHGSAPRIRSRFTTILMEERARLSFSASRSEALSSRHDEQTEEDAAEIRPHGPDPSTLVSRLSAQVDGPDVAIDEQDSSQGRVLHTEDAAMERPPRVLRCYSCQHIWISTLAADLRECPECGSYSVFAESPRRTASPDNADFSHHAVAPGEAALGQYFSERTDKYMNLYRREQPRLRSTTDSHESLPNPWGHLQNSSNTSLAKAGRTPPKEPQTDPLAKICYTCRHRFARPADRDEGKCPKCGSEFVFTDKSWDTTFRVSATDAPKTDQPRSLLHPLGIAPLQLSNLILDIEDVAAKLQGLQDRHSNNTRDVPEAVDQFLCLSTGFRRLAKLQEDPEYELRFHRVQETVQILCSSIQYTVAVLLNTLRSPLDETQWMKLCASMQNVEKINILERLRWYQASILGLLDHLDGFTSESLLGMDANIRSLLERQRNVRRSDPVDELSKASGTQREMLPEASTSTSCYACHAQLPDWSAVSKADACPNCGSWFMSNPSTPPRDNEIQEVKPAEPDTESESKDLVQAEHQASISQQLTRLIDDTEHAMTRLQRFQDQNYGNATGITEIIDEMLSLRNSFRKLSQLCADPNYDPNFLKVQEPIQTLCRSMQHTLNAMLEVLTAEAEANETAWTTWVMLSIRMAGAEQVGLPERLKWYSASILGLLNHLDGFPSAGRIFSWLGMDEKVRSLLERQEAVAQEAELAKQNKEVDTPEPAPFREEDATSEKLICIIRDCGEVATGLQELEAGHSRQSARIHECMNQVLDLRESLEQLYSLRNDPLNWSSLSKKEQPIRKTCHSIKYTLDDLLEALNAGTEDEKWKRWGELNVRMVEAEKFILSGRLIWYEGIVSAILGGFDKFLDGAWNFQWEIVEEPMRELLERQRSVRSER